MIAGSTPVEDIPRRALAWTAGLAVIAFALIAWDVVAHGPLSSADVPVAQWLHAHLHPVLTPLVLGLTQLHGTAAMCGLLLPASALLMVWRSQWRWAVLLVATVLSGMAFNNFVLKPMFARARPSFDDPALVLATYSFPSGHVLAATLFYGVLCAMVLSREHGRPRPSSPEQRLSSRARPGINAVDASTSAGVTWIAGQARNDSQGPSWHYPVAAITGAVLMVFLVAFSRLYLGVHYLSDAAGGVAEGLAWLSLCLWLGGPVPKPDRLLG